MKAQLKTASYATGGVPSFIYWIVEASKEELSLLESVKRAIPVIDKVTNMPNPAGAWRVDDAASLDVFGKVPNIHVGKPLHFSPRPLTEKGENIHAIVDLEFTQNGSIVRPNINAIFEQAFAQQDARTEVQATRVPVASNPDARNLRATAFAKAMESMKAPVEDPKKVGQPSAAPKP